MAAEAINASVACAPSPRSQETLAGHCRRRRDVRAKGNDEEDEAPAKATEKVGKERNLEPQPANARGFLHLDKPVTGQ